jgi:hypothetical protein
MKVMAIIGSPRRGGNTELLVDRVIEGCRSRGDTHIEKVFITERAIQYCSGCLSCTFPPPGTGKCVLRDDMDIIIEQVRESDAFEKGGKRRDTPHNKFSFLRGHSSLLKNHSGGKSGSHAFFCCW